LKPDPHPNGPDGFETRWKKLSGKGFAEKQRTNNGGNNESGCGLRPTLSFMSKDPELIR
jgi:hypothetical protein